MITPLQAYLNAEAVCYLEEESGEINTEPEFINPAIAAADQFADRVLERANRLAPALGLDMGIERAWKHLKLAFIFCAVLSFLLGAAVTRAIPEGYPARVNITALMVILLLPNLVSLMLWTVLSLAGIIRPAADQAQGWLGRRVYGFGRLLAGILPLQQPTVAATVVLKNFLLRTRAGRRHLLIYSHGLWLLLLGGSLAACWWLMAVRQVDFVWGTTVLSPATVQSILMTLTDMVGWSGLPVPDQADVLSSRVDAAASGEILRRKWGLFVLGAVLIMGVLPRLAALVIDVFSCLALRRVLRPEITRPGYARLQPYLMPVSHTRKIIDPDDPLPASGPVTPAGPPSFDALPQDAAWLALDHVPESAPPGVRVEADLGVIASHSEQQRVLDRLHRPERSWRAVCVYIDLGLTPDRGTARLLNDLVAASRLPVHALLAGTRRFLLLNGGDRSARLQDWLLLLQATGITADRIHQ